MWRPSLPVIHLAAATQVLLHLAERGGATPMTIGDLIWSQPAIEYIVREGERYETILGKNSRLKIHPDKQIKLRLASNSLHFFLHS